MRAKVVIPILGFTGLILLLAGMVRFGMVTPVAGPPAVVTAINSGAATAVSPVQTSAPRTGVAGSARPSFQPQIDSAALQEQRQEASARRVDELAQLASSQDPKSLRTILSDLTNDDKDIRRAALAAALDYGDRSAIPALQRALEAIPDPQEKVSIQQAINYLKLPTLTEENLSLETGKTPSLPSNN